MASSDSAVTIVDSADLADDGPMVKVDRPEKGSLFSFLTGSKTEDNEEMTTEDSKPGRDFEKSKHEPKGVSHTEVVHEGDGIKSTYDVEEDDPPSLLEQLKRKVHWSGR